jgi:hypothetical protein
MVDINVNVNVNVTVNDNVNVNDEEPYINERSIMLSQVGESFINTFYPKRGIYHPLDKFVQYQNYVPKHVEIKYDLESISKVTCNPLVNADVIESSSFKCKTWFIEGQTINEIKMHMPLCILDKVINDNISFYVGKEIFYELKILHLFVIASITNKAIETINDSLIINIPFKTIFEHFSFKCDLYLKINSQVNVNVNDNVNDNNEHNKIYDKIKVTATKYDYHDSHDPCIFKSISFQSLCEIRKIENMQMKIKIDFLYIVPYIIILIKPNVIIKEISLSFYGDFEYRLQSSLNEIHELNSYFGFKAYGISLCSEGWNDVKNVFDKNQVTGHGLNFIRFEGSKINITFDLNDLDDIDANTDYEVHIIAVKHMVCRQILHKVCPY